MAYTLLPDRRIPYDNDGTAVYYRVDDTDSFVGGPASEMTGTQMQNFQDTNLADNFSGGSASIKCYYFFPEEREITGCFVDQFGGGNGYTTVGYYAEGSTDSTNGMDGAWEAASFPGGNPLYNVGTSWTAHERDGWRSRIKAVSFTGPKKVLRSYHGGNAAASANVHWATYHLYGEKGAGETPDDIVYINHDDTPGVEFTGPEDFGDQPLGTTVVRQFRVKNVSGSKTANTINIQCNDSDFAISEDGVIWVVTINIASLSAGAESPTLYVRCTTPDPGASLGPRFARIVTTVASYT